MAIKVQGTVVIDNDRNAIIGSGTTAQRPQNPQIGTIWFNTTLGVLEGWTGSEWAIMAE